MFTIRRLGHLCGRVILILLLAVPFTAGVAHADPSDSISAFWTALSPGPCPRVADPKLDGGGVPFSFTLNPRGYQEPVYDVTVEVIGGSEVVRQLANLSLTGSRVSVKLWWDGRDQAGQFVPPGEYSIRVSADSLGTVFLIEYLVNIVRLGITEIEALPESIGEEHQMVYFRKGSQYAFYATPAIHEYLNIARSGEVSDLDLNSGEPRPAAAVHTATDSPVLDGSSYDTECYNYPLCYLMASRPQFKVTMGDSCTLADGTAGDCGYPVPGVQIRGLAEDPAGFWEGDGSAIGPGQSFFIDGPELPDRAGRTDRTVTWRWQYLESGGNWTDIPGSLEIEHRFYTIVDQPYWTPGASGTQYAGPWVEVADYFSTWADALMINPLDQALTLKALIRGYFGQEGPLDTAIEGVVYDCYPMGGDGGACHYYSFWSEHIELSRLLHYHDNGIYLNCSDVASSTSVMLGMLGVQNVRMVYLGSMSLRALWGVGCPDYTLDLWGGSHGFSYHHIITRDDGIHVSDACMWLDEDGDPDSLPGMPGYNTDRPWSGIGGYNDLSSTNDVSMSLDSLPDIQ